MNMDRKSRSLMGGAALAALLILPSLSGHASARHAPPPPPAAPAAAPAAPAAPANVDWVRWPVKSYSTNAVKLEDIVGTLTVNLGQPGEDVA